MAEVDWGKYDPRTPAANLNVGDAVGVNPDQAAEEIKLARRFGQPVGVVSEYRDDYKQKAAVEDTRAAIKSSPKLVDWLAYKPENARVSQDDVNNLSLIETMTNSFKRGIPSLKSMFPSLRLADQAAGLNQLDAIDRGEITDPAQVGVIGAGYLRMNPEQRAAFRAKVTPNMQDTVTGAAVEIARLSRERSAIPQPDVVTNVMNAPTFSDALKAFGNSPAQFIAAIGPESLVQSAPGMVAAVPASLAAGPAGAAATMGGNSFLVDYANTLMGVLAKEGVDIEDAEAVRAAVRNPALLAKAVEQAGKHAGVVGAVDAASGGLAGKMLLPAGAMATRPLGKQLANIAVQAPIQGVLGGLGEAGGQVAAGQEIQPGEIVAEVFGEFFGTPAEVVSASAGRLREMNTQARAAEAAAKQAEDLTKLADSSLLKGRDAESFREFVANVAEEGGEAPTEFYIDSKQLLNSLNQSGMTMAELNALAPSVASQLQNAETDTDIRVPVSEFLSAPAEATKPLIDHLRVTPDSMSRAEAQEFMKTQGEQLQADVERELARRDDQASFRDAIAGVQAEFEAELGRAGRFTPEVNKAYAGLLANFYGATAARLGMTPEQLLAKYQLRVASELVPGQNQLDQPAYHGSPHRGIEQFTTQKIGTGEGAQAYGWGMYFAANKDIAEFYRKALARSTVVHKPSLLSRGVELMSPDGKAPSLATLEKAFPGIEGTALDSAYAAVQRVSKANGVDAAIKQLEGELAFTHESGIPYVQGQIDWLKANKKSLKFKKDPGQLYTVEVPEDSDLLDYDAKLADQPEKVRAALEKLGLSDDGYGVFLSGQTEPTISFNGEGALRKAQRYVSQRNLNATVKPAPMPLTGGQMYQKLVEKFKTPEAASRALFAAGIPGLRFADASSRGKNAADVTHNYVIFDDSAVKKTGELYQSAQDQTQTEAFKKWFGDSKVVDADGKPLVVYHGSGRPDRIGERFRKDRATSGPMSFFTDNPAIASNYATGKTDTSIALEDDAFNYENWFRIETPKGLLNLKDAWNALPARDRVKLREMAPKIKRDDDTGENIVVDQAGTRGNGGYHAQTNVLMALKEAWLDSGDMFDSEQDFIQVLRLAGLKANVEFQSPHETMPAVLPVYLSIQNPIDTSKIAPEVVEALRKASAGREAQIGGVDNWDKNTISGEDWMQRLDGDIKDGTTHAWTSIPDWVTDTLREQGFDGIKDTGGKGGGVGHNVWIPFEETQVKSATGNRGAFDPNDPNILNQDGDNRAKLSFADDITTSPSVITLLAGADLTSFIHESGHFFLEVQADLAQRIQSQISGGATVSTLERGVVEDFNKLLDWFGIKGDENLTPLDAWSQMTLEQKRESHEKFARGFEAYAFEGNAPSLALREIFAKFRAWMVQVYKTLRGLNVTLNDDVRAVMGRMLASDFAIEEAEAARSMGMLFKTQADAERFGLSMEAYQDLQAIGQAATGRAEMILDERMLRDLKWMSGAKSKFLKSKQAEVDAIRRDTRRRVQAEVMSQPVYRAWDFLTKKGERVKAGEVDVNQEVTQETGKLRTSAVKEMAPDQADALAERRMTQEKDGLHPDVVAELFEFESGQQLMDALTAAKEPQALIDQMTDQRMLEEHGDINSPEAMALAADEAVHNELRARAIATELAAVQYAGRVMQTDERGGTLERRRVDVLAKAAKAYAEQVISQIAIRDLRPEQYAAAEARAAKAAEKALAAGKTDEVILHKRNQLVNNFAAKAAMEAKAKIAKDLEFFRKVNAGSDKKIAETRDVGIVSAARAVLAEYGLSTKDKPASAYLDSMAQSDPAMYQVLKDRIDVLTDRAVPYRQLTIEQFDALADEIRGMWHQSKRVRQVEIDGELLDRTKVQLELQQRLEDIGVPGRVPGEGKAVTDAERRTSMLRSGLAALRRVESWVDGMDGTKSNVFRRYVWQPVREAADRYRADKAVYLRRYRDLLKGLDLGQSKIDAPELGYTFGYSHGGSGKQEIVHAILHTGNESNKRKLLLGRGWAEQNPDGSLDTSRWDKFIQRMIDEGVIGKAEFDFAQGVWNLLEDMKPAAQKAHRDVFGRYFAEVTADEFTVKLGGQDVTYKGGYVPALTDAEVVRDAKTRELMEGENQTLAFAFPTTSKGFTKSRVEYNKALLLDLRSLSSHIDKVLLFSHMEQPIRDVRKVLSSKDVAEPLNRIDPAAFDALLTPWLNRSARQQVETPVPGANGLMRFFTKARSRTGMAAMFANVTNTAQQITGLSIAAVKVKPRHLLAATAQMMHSPKQTAEAVAQASQYMATRMDNEVAQMSDSINDILLNPSVLKSAQNWTQRHAYFMQSAVDNYIGPIVWTGAYNQAIEVGKSEKEAVRAADAAVRQTQGSTAPEDVSRFETGNAFVRMFTQFYGYFNMQANLLGTEFATGMRELGLRKGIGRGVYVFTFGFLAPALVSELIVQSFRGGPGDDDQDGEYLDDWLAALFFGTVRSGAAMVPAGGQIFNATVNSFNDKPYDDRISTSPAISMIERSAMAPNSVYEAVFEDGKTSKAVKDTATLISLLVGVPANSVARPLGYLADVMEDRVEPLGPADAVRGAITGVASPESKQ